MTKLTCLSEHSLTTLLAVARATPLPPDERRAASSRRRSRCCASAAATSARAQIAEAAGIAEGTIFRVFTTKDAADRRRPRRRLRPASTLQALDAIDRDARPRDAGSPRRHHPAAADCDRVFALFYALGFRPAGPASEDDLRPTRPARPGRRDHACWPRCSPPTPTGSRSRPRARRRPCSARSSSPSATRCSAAIASTSPARPARDRRPLPARRHCARPHRTRKT